MNDKRTGANPYGDISRNVAARQESPGKKVAVIVVAAVVVLALVAVLATQCGKDSSPAGKNTGAAQAQNATQQTAAVSVTGNPLPPYPSCAGLVADAATDPATGKTPPTLKGETFDAKPLTIAPGGTAKVVVFVAHWCPHCQAEVPLIQKWIDEGNQPSDVEIYAVATATTEARPNYPASAWIATEKFAPQVLLDDEQGTAAAAYGLTGFPYIVFIDKDGKVAHRASGEVPIDQFDELVNNLSTSKKQ
ncbi:MAG: TlpA family protein disulfide reductase [Actinomycetes bacterium]